VGSIDLVSSSWSLLKMPKEIPDVEIQSKEEGLKMTGEKQVFEDAWKGLSSNLSGEKSFRWCWCWCYNSGSEREDASFRFGLSRLQYQVETREHFRVVYGPMNEEQVVWAD